MKQVELVNAIKDIVGGDVSKADIKNMVKLIYEKLGKRIKNDGIAGALDAANILLRCTHNVKGVNPKAVQLLKTQVQRLQNLKKIKP